MTAEVRLDYKECHGLYSNGVDEQSEKISACMA